MRKVYVNNYGKKHHDDWSEFIVNCVGFEVVDSITEAQMFFMPPFYRDIDPIWKGVTKAEGDLVRDLKDISYLRYAMLRNMEVVAIGRGAQVLGIVDPRVTLKYSPKSVIAKIQPQVELDSFTNLNFEYDPLLFEKLNQLELSAGNSPVTAIGNNDFIMLVSDGEVDPIIEIEKTAQRILICNQEIRPDKYGSLAQCVIDLMQGMGSR